jgi:hypothetical protein
VVVTPENCAGAPALKSVLKTTAAADGCAKPTQTTLIAQSHRFSLRMLKLDWWSKTMNVDATLSSARFMASLPGRDATPRKRAKQYS